MKPTSAPVKILVRAPNWIGDQVLSFPFFFRLRQLFPRARISVACMPWVGAIQYRDLIDEVVVLPKPKAGAGIVEKIEVLQQSSALLAGKGPWDFGLSLPNSLSAAWLLYRAGCRVRRGYRGDFRAWLLTEALPWKKSPILHRTDAYLGLLSFAPAAYGAENFWGIPPDNDLDEGVAGALDSFPLERAWPLEPGQVPVDSPSGDYWVLAPGAAAESRRWAVEKFGSLIELIHKQTGWHCVVVGGPAEAEAGRELSALPGVTDRTARGPVHVYGALFRGARLTVANDSGLAHVASLCGSRVHIVWGAGDSRRTAPIGPGKVTMTFNPVECWPCERNVCYKEGAERLQCLNGIQPEQVWEDIQSGSKRTRKSDVD